MKQNRSNNAKIARETKDLERALLQLPDNPIPWPAVLAIVAPVLARLAIRLALKKVARSMSEERVNTIGDSVADTVGDIIARRTS